MNIIRENIDPLNTIIKINIVKDDYSEKLEKILKDYRKTANFPGFRKGHVPMGILKKKYSNAIISDEVNKILQDSLSKYIKEEKLNYLGYPLPIPVIDLDWNSDSFTFEYEMGLHPEFTLDFNNKKAIAQYKILADNNFLDKLIRDYREDYGFIVSEDKVTIDNKIYGVFENKDYNINNPTSFTLDIFNDKSTQELFLNAEVGDIIVLNTKDLFKSEQDIFNHFNTTPDVVKDSDFEVNFTISEIVTIQYAELNQEFFDNILGKNEATNETEFRQKIKDDFEKKFETSSDTDLFSKVSDYLIENTKFDLPVSFIQKWLLDSKEDILDTDDAKKEFENSEKHIRYEIIVNQLKKTYDLNVSFDELKEYARKSIRARMEQMGYLNPTDSQVEEAVTRVLSEKIEVEALTDVIFHEKLLNLFKEKLTLKTKEIAYTDFMKEISKNS